MTCEEAPILESAGVPSLSCLPTDALCVVLRLLFREQLPLSQFLSRWTTLRCVCKHWDEVRRQSPLPPCRR